MRVGSGEKLPNVPAAIGACPVEMPLDGSVSVTYRTIHDRAGEVPHTRTGGPDGDGHSPGGEAAERVGTPAESRSASVAEGEHRHDTGEGVRDWTAFQPSRSDGPN
jgi:hypothetical protein